MEDISRKLDETLTEEEKEKYLDMKKSNKKVKGTATNILEECMQQDFTVREFEMLVEKLDVKLQLEQVIAKEKTKLSI